MSESRPAESGRGGARVLRRRRGRLRGLVLLRVRHPVRGLAQQVDLRQGRHERHRPARCVALLLLSHPVPPQQGGRVHVSFDENYSIH